LSFFEAALLGLIQGLTEFLPISSSGHLVLGQAILGIEVEGIAFEIFVHFGTLLSVVTIYRKELFAMFAECLKFLFGKKAPLEAQTTNYPNGVKMLFFIILGVAPTAVLGILFKDFFESAFSSLTIVSASLIFTGTMLLSTRFIRKSSSPLTPVKAFFIGLAQVIAFFPGVSRSGTTITAGLWFGVEPEDAARYSFMLAIPLILGVTLLAGIDLIEQPPPLEQIFQYAVGALMSYLSGLWAIKWLIGVVQGGRFSRFAYYCFAVGGVGLAYQLL